MKVLLTCVVFLSMFSMVSRAEERISDLVIYFDNNIVSPGEETNDDYIIICYDASGRKISIGYKYDPITNKVVITGATGVVYVVIIDKKTKQTRKVKVEVKFNA